MIDIAIILISVICDALTESWVGRHVNWELYHIIRWIGMFGLWGRLAYNVQKKYGWLMVIILAFVCNVLWNLIYRL